MPKPMVVLSSCIILSKYWGFIFKLFKNFSERECHDLCIIIFCLEIVNNSNTRGRRRNIRNTWNSALTSRSELIFQTCNQLQLYNFGWHLKVTPWIRCISHTIFANLCPPEVEINQKAFSKQIIKSNSVFRKDCKMSSRKIQSKNRQSCAYKINK